MSTGAYPRTKFFRACRGVFEGGGCRGAAHIGAYEAAIRAGVNFSEVAGTSAGSIIAALIGAGATPEFLLQKCAYLKFSELLTKPKGNISTGFLARWIGPFVRGDKRLLGQIMAKGSAYSSQQLEEWLDDLLAELLPNATRPIKFKDLRLPTWVVATDLSGRRPKIWSSRDTPDEVVSTAVRSSCSIPLFFEPVESGNTLYVDGGMLSNLPAFVFANRQDGPLALGGRVLGFRLSESINAKPERNLPWLVKRLVDTAISGATEIQGSIQSNVSVISIPTGDVSSINFDISKEDVDVLLNFGRNAMLDFVKDEHAQLKDSLSSDIARYGEDELFDDLTREMAIPGRRLIVACTRTRWFWDLFPSIIHWMFAGANVDIVVQDGAASSREKSRRELLQKLGARIVMVSQVPLSCFLLSRQDASHNALFIQSDGEQQFAPKGLVYIGMKHRLVIETFLKMLDALIPSVSVDNTVLTLQVEAPATTIDLLKKGVHQYGAENVTIEAQQVALRQLDKPVHMIVRRVRSFKFRQIVYLYDLYKRHEIPFCAPVSILANGKFVSSILPPVLEKWGNKLIAIEGNTRVFYLHGIGVDSVLAYVVDGVSSALPGTPVEPRDVLLSTYELPVNERIKNLVLENFRKVEGAIRPAE